MDPFDAIRKERKAGKLFCGTAARADSAVAAAASFGLKGDAGLYHEIEAEMARDILAGVLHRDLAYGNRLMSLARAEELATQVIQRFADPKSRFFTNGEFKQNAAVGLVLSDWDPATDATFDTGVIILGASEAACVWVADED
jgi:hypothetical protein